MPFFLYVAHVAPLWPLHAREADIAPHRPRYRGRGWDEWFTARRKFQEVNGLIPVAWPPAPRPREIHPWADDAHQEWQAERMAVYAAQVASIDRSTGRILEALRARGELDNTLVLFLSDNGAAPDGGLKPTSGGFGFNARMPAGNWRLDGAGIRVGSGPDLPPGRPDTFAAYGLAWALTSGAPFCGTKLTGYEGGIRTPLIAHWPAGIAARGKIVNDVGHVIDLMPTFLELACGSYPSALGVRKPIPLDGRSLAPLFRGESLPPRGSLAWRVPQHRVLCSGDWKLISRDETTHWELYDLAADGTETTNLAERKPDVIKQPAAEWQACSESCQKSK
jgi:arylsulfatase A-like enzyme